MDCLLINGYGIRTAAVGFPASLGSKMEDKEAAREDACREYQSSLEDLTFNSKPHINMLTILAEENLNFAKDIVAIIEAQISKVFMKNSILYIAYGSCLCGGLLAEHGGGYSTCQAAGCVSGKTLPGVEISDDYSAIRLCRAGFKPGLDPDLTWFKCSPGCLCSSVKSRLNLI